MMSTAGEIWGKLQSFPLRYAALLGGVFAALCLFSALEVRDLESGDETRVAGITAEMSLTKDYLIPRLNGEPFLEYPPLYYWGGCLSFSLFGRNDFAAKVPSAAVSLLSGLLVFFFVLRMGAPPWAALAGEIFLLTGAQFFNTSRRCMVDPMLAFFVLLALYGFWEILKNSSLRSFAAGILCWIIGLAGGVMTKGLVGLVLPMGGCGMFLILSSIRDRRVIWRRWFAAGGGILAALGLVSVWYALIYFKAGEKLFHIAFYVNNVGRFSGSQGDHTREFWFYFAQLPTLFLPYLPLLFFALWDTGRRVWRKQAETELFLLCALLVPFLLLTAAAGKRIVYLMPLYAPAALLCAHCLSVPRVIPERWKAVRLPRFTGIAAGGAVLVVLLTEFVLLKGSGRLYPVLALVLLAAFFLPSTDWRRKLFCAAAATALAVASIDAVHGVFRQPYDSVRPLFALCRTLERQGMHTVLLVPHERTQGAAVFYLGHTVATESRTDLRVPPGECHILRSREKVPGAIPFADRHYLRLPER